MNAQDWLLRLRDIGWRVLSNGTPVASPLLTAAPNRSLRVDTEPSNSSRLAFGRYVWLRAEP